MDREERYLGGEGRQQREDKGVCLPGPAPSTQNQAPSAQLAVKRASKRLKGFKSGRPVAAAAHFGASTGAALPPEPESFGLALAGASA